MARAFASGWHHIFESFAMGYRMREGLAYCIAGGRSIFLDVEADRYFGLQHDWDLAFQALVAAGSTGPQLSALVNAGILVEAEIEAEFTAPVIVAANQEMVSGALKPSLRLIAKFVVAQIRAASALRTKALAEVLQGIDQRAAATKDAAGDGPEPRWQPLVAAFFASSHLRPRSGHCLTNSIAFMRVARSLGYKPQLILGVCAAPFSAHCWVQAGDYVLNDRIENIRTFEPILAL
ncbi:lasso peptide biosynthesis B2 protein [Sphingobium sp. HWE2-09]|uniref:lasso peptide biosynthesis B2 protein n=1 Tax=Sphingobium sp. HWE2-09 TaxID=3108390 RepID=UPI002DC52B92|nr:lasso peptide biosynthesis B2 protein [Sphingobium sp. HWE2-09]